MYCRNSMLSKRSNNTDVAFGGGGLVEKNARVYITLFSNFCHHLRPQLVVRVRGAATLIREQWVVSSVGRRRPRVVGDGGG